MSKSSHSTPAPFLPMSRQEMIARGWDRPDVLLITGDAYVDHPAFGAAVIGRVLEAAGYRVGIIAQPDWTQPESFAVMGAPALFVGVTAGAMDSMVANYTANRKLRRDDAYTPSGAAGRRPNYATIVYTSVARHVFKGVPVVLGGIEASLRRFAHFDYWKESVRRSILLDAKADLIVAGMGEKQILEIARRLRAGESLHAIPGTVEALGKGELPQDALGEAVQLPSLEAVTGSKQVFLEAAKQLEQAIVCDRRHPIVQPHGERLVVEWPPEEMTTEELDAVYALPFQRRSHPSYQEKIPALEPIQFSVVSHRGCFGGCTFCALALHQGRRIVSRSEGSILKEIEGLARHRDFRGTISDLGGPSANMYRMAGRDARVCAACRRPSCLHPAVCANLNLDYGSQVRLLRRALAVPGVKHLFVASGVRYDMLVVPDGKEVRPEAREYFALLVERLTGGHLSVAPEHASARVLQAMRKPPFEMFLSFSRLFVEWSARMGKEQYLIPYFIASFPGSTDRDMEQVASFLKRSGRRLQQIQDFLAGPMTLAAAMYYAQMDPQTIQPIYVATTAAQRRRQRDFLLDHHAQQGPDKAVRPNRPSGSAKTSPHPPRQPARTRRRSPR